MSVSILLYSRPARTAAQRATSRAFARLACAIGKTAYLDTSVSFCEAFREGNVYLKA
jgi:hypothetical protein